MYYSYVLTLKDKMEREGPQSVSYNELINVIWSLCALEDETLHNPLIPKLYERLHTFNRPERGLTREELLELYQVANVHAQDQMKTNKWPKEFKDVVPKRVKDLCEEEFAQFDKNLYTDV